MNKTVKLTYVIYLFVGRLQLSLLTTPCCMPHQYEAALTELGATLHDGSTTLVIADGKLAMVYDYDMKRTWVKNYGLHASETPNVTVITHYDEGTQYILSSDTCFFRSVRLDAMQKPCIPEHFFLESTLTLGSTIDGIPIQRWKGVMNGMTSVFTVEPSNCTPIFQSLYGTESNLDKQEREFMNYIFTDYKPHVNTPHIFDFPSQCRNAKPLGGKRELAAEKILSKLPLFL